MRKRDRKNIVRKQDKKDNVMRKTLKGLSHEIFRPDFWPVWMHLVLNVNRLWF